LLIQRGVRFKNQNADALNRAEQQYGVSQAVILGILGFSTARVAKSKRS
jgi:membrane-bound lytic murein transglycosylase B